MFNANAKFQNQANLFGVDFQTQALCLFKLKMFKFWKVRPGIEQPQFGVTMQIFKPKVQRRKKMDKNILEFYKEEG